MLQILYANWLILIVVVVGFIVLFDHIRTEIQWYRWWREQQRRNRK